MPIKLESIDIIKSSRQIKKTHEENRLLVDWVIEMTFEISCENEYMRCSGYMSKKKMRVGQ